MTCDDVKRLVSVYHDGELDAVRADEVERHVESCPDCAAQLSTLRALSRTLRSAPYFQAPPTLTEALRPRRTPRIEHARPRLTTTIPWLIAAASLVALIAITVPLHFGRIGEQSTAEAVMSSHLRSLMADHLVDVASSDRHTVKPWFAGRIDFSPTVVDLSAEGFPLVGGRLDYIDGHPVAALVYLRRQHTINAFVWPSASGQAAVTHQDDPRGYHLVHWTSDRMTWWVVSDLASTELNDFADRLRAATATGS